jgi:hypothetical protein
MIRLHDISGAEVFIAPEAIDYIGEVAEREGNEKTPTIPAHRLVVLRSGKFAQVIESSEDIMMRTVALLSARGEEFAARIAEQLLDDEGLMRVRTIEPR